MMTPLPHAILKVHPPNSLDCRARHRAQTAVILMIVPESPSKIANPMLLRPDLPGWKVFKRFTLIDHDESST